MPSLCECVCAPSARIVVLKIWLDVVHSHVLTWCLLLLLFVIASKFEIFSSK